jgi:hypothetical protein
LQQLAYQSVKQRDLRPTSSPTKRDLRERSPSEMPEELSLMLPDGLSVKCTQTAERLTLDGPAASLAKFFRTSTRSFPYLDVLHTSFDTRSATLVIHFLPHKQHQAGMHTLKGSVMDSLQADRAALWASSLMSKAYPSALRRGFAALLNVSRRWTRQKTVQGLAQPVRSILASASSDVLN